MHFSDRPIQHDLGDGLRLRSLASNADIERVAAFNKEIHGAGVDAMARGLMKEHPAARPPHWLLVEDIATGAVAAALCLLPWTLRYGDVELRAGELGLVGTAEAYRRRGLQRTLYARFDALLREGGFVLSHIQGIGYFYRQFGYDYAMPLEADWRMEPYLTPDADTTAYEFRAATTGDIPLLARWYDEAAATLDISATRDKQVWAYLLGPSTTTALTAQTSIIERSGAPVGYLRISEHGFGTGLIVSEASALRADDAPAVLRWLAGVAAERGKPYIRFNLPADTPLLVMARAYGAHHAGTYAWQVRVPDVAAFVRATAPVLEARVARSVFRGTTRTLRLDLRRSVVALRWQDGRLVEVVADAGDDGDVWLLPQLVGPLMLGHRSLADLSHTYPDVGAKGGASAFVDVLWPPMRSFLYTQY